MTAGADTTPTRGRRTIAWACAALGAGVAVGACWAYFTSADGFVTNPDYWGLRHLGERVELRDPATWRNGFYPWLTVLLYGAYAAFDIGVRGATAVATVAMGVACLAVGSLGARRGRVTATLFGALSLLALPGWITNAATPTTDTIACAWVAIALAVGVSDGAKGAGARFGADVGRAAFAAVLLGLATAFRFHTIAFALPFAIACGLFGAWSRRGAIVAVAILALFGAVPGLVNLADGRPFGDSAQLLNLYKTLRPALWTSLHPDDLAGVSALDLLTDDPGATLQTWWRWFTPQAPFVAFSAVAWGVFRRGVSGRFLGSIAVASLLCGAATALGSSEHAVLLTGMLAVASGVVALAHAEPGPRRSAWSLVCAVAVAVCAWSTRSALAEDHGFRTRVAGHAAQLEAVSRDLGIERSSQAFTNEVFLYFPTMPPGPLSQNGGWGGFDLPGWRDVYPELCADDLECLHRSAVEAGVCVMLLSPQAVTVGPAFAPLVETTRPIGPFRPVDALGPTKVFLVQGACDSPWRVTRETTPLPAAPSR